MQIGERCSYLMFVKGQNIHRSESTTQKRTTAQVVFYSLYLFFYVVQNCSTVLLYWLNLILLMTFASLDCISEFGISHNYIKIFSFRNAVVKIFKILLFWVV